MPVILQEARKLAWGDGFIADDLVQEGVMAVLRALDSYDPARGSENGYIRTCARNGMISYLRRNRHECSMDEDVLEARVRDSTSEQETNADEQQEVIEIREALASLLQNLSPFEEEVLDAYLRGGGVSGAVMIMRCDRKKVDNALQRIRNKARALRGDML
ncbi:MAG: sigma-70 family RNA polymerase sigma factor [Synergistaceae bacterium]|jgi:RNA polymerase sporulation-specific sigma factor|nr:sigma-70 family RNA polymerase sigma factor [Synergistaceae bacterium]